MTSTSGTGNWIFLSDRGNDEYINMFAAGCGTTPIDIKNFSYTQSVNPIVLRGILKYKLMNQCRQDSRTFYYMDTGYAGNNPCQSNPQGFKLWHRIVPNNLQHSLLTERPGDRWERLKIPLAKQQRRGSKIVIAAPDEKPCRAYGIDLDQWIENTVNTIKQHTDRPIEIRSRPVGRKNRSRHNTLEQALHDAHALVTFNSNAATEAIMLGYPAFVLAPVHAADPVANRDLSRIESPYYPSQDKLYAWACHLAYCQFHINELKNGQAKIILEATQ